MSSDLPEFIFPFGLGLRRRRRASMLILFAALLALVLVVSPSETEIEAIFEGEDEYAIGTALFDPVDFARTPDPGVQPLYRTAATATPSEYTVPPIAECYHPVRHQGGCGSCWALATATMLEDRFCIAAGGDTIGRISPQNYISCDHTCVSGVCNTGCSYGHYIPGLMYTASVGATLETCIPYAGSSAIPCSSTCTAGPSVGAPKPLYKVDPYYRLTSEYQIMADLLQYGPVAVQMAVYSDFFTYSGGVYRKSATATYRGGHAITIVGWENKDGVPCWKVRNSWGTGFGEAGFFYVQRGVNEVGIEGVVVGALPIVQQALVTVTVANPAQGDTIFVGQSEQVSWQFVGTPVPSSVKLELLNASNAVVSTLAASVASSPSTYAWNVPVSIATGSGYKIRVSGLPDGPTATSGAFSISDTAAVAITPIPGPHTIGSTHTVTYAVAGTPPAASVVVLQLLNAAGSAVFTIASSAASTEGTHAVSFTYPSTLAVGTYRVKASLGSVSDTTAGFELVAPSAEEFTITRPVDGTTVLPGSQMIIQWTNLVASPATYVNISLRDSLGFSHSIVNVYNSGAYVWTVSSSLAAGAYQLVLADYQHLTDSTEGPTFTIGSPVVVDPVVIIDGPVTGTTWTLGSPYEIRWHLSQGSLDRVSIALRRAGAQVLLIASSAANTGSLSFTPPASLTPGDDYSVRVASTADPSIYGSGGTFALAAAPVPEPDPQPSISVSRPLAGSVLVAGSTYTVTWSVQNMFAGTSLQIAVVNASGAVLRAEDPVLAGTGSTSFFVPTDAPVGATLHVRVSSADVVAVSPGFTVAQPPMAALEVTTPSDAPQLATVRFVWAAQEALLGEDLTLLLFPVGSVAPLLVARGVPASDGAVDYVIPECVPAGAYRLRVRSEAASPVYADTDIFNILEADVDTETLPPPADEVTPVPPPEPPVEPEPVPVEPEPDVPTDGNIANPLVIVSPVAGNDFAHGETIRIRWLSQTAYASSPVMISAWKETSLLQFYEFRYPNAPDATYEITVPRGWWPTVNAYSIQLRVSSPEPYTVQSGLFSVHWPVVSITSGSGGIIATSASTDAASSAAPSEGDGSGPMMWTRGVNAKISFGHGEGFDPAVKTKRWFAPWRPSKADRFTAECDAVQLRLLQIGRFVADLAPLTPNRGELDLLVPDWLAPGAYTVQLCVNCSGDRECVTAPVIIE
jgi:hypothetical protein